MKNVQHIKKFEQGKQGVTGLVDIDGKPHVYKISQFLNYLPEHEFLVMKGLNELEPYCPHFCKSIDLRPFQIHPDFREKDQNPFEPHSKSLTLNVLLMEYIPLSIPMLSLIETDGVDFASIISSIKQVLMAILFAQRQKKFTHYDLHSLNVLLKSCSKDQVNLYVLDADNVLCVPTYGVIPVIIDYGFGTVEDFQGKPMYCSLAYTDAGYMSPAYDYLADFKLFLVSVAEDMYENRHFHYNPIKKFRNIVKNLFQPLEIDWKSGWDIHRDPPLIDQIYSYIQSDDLESTLFTKYSHYCVDMLQSLITLPLEPSVRSSMNDLRRYYRCFVKEIVKIEEEVQNVFYSLYIFRKLVDLTRHYTPVYIQLETRQDAVRGFERDVFVTVRTVAKFCRLKNVNFEKLLCSLIIFQDHLKTQLFYLLQQHLQMKEEEYTQLEIHEPEHIYGIIDYNFPMTYSFSPETSVVVYDLQRRIQDRFTLTAEELPSVNSAESMCKGQLLYEYYLSRLENQIQPVSSDSPKEKPSAKKGGRRKKPETKDDPPQPKEKDDPPPPKEKDDPPQPKEKDDPPPLKEKDDPPPLKKRGKPKKKPETEDDPPQPKKRGRPKKKPETKDDPPQPKKRGRPKKKLEPDVLKPCTLATK